LKRLILTGDVLRPQDEAFRPAQNGNIAWLHRLIRRPVSAAAGVELETLEWGPGGFDTARFYELAGFSPDIEGWVAAFDAPELPREAASMLAEPFAKAAAVIGFELAEVQKRLLSQLRVPWVDLNIHPYRFGPDVLFALQTNHPGMLEALRAHHAEDADFEPWADLMAATASKMPPDPPPTESCLVVGQTRVDRALVSGGRLLDLRDVAPALHAAIGPEARIAFKPHPYNPEGFGLFDIGLPLRRIREVAENVYVLLGQDALKRVVGLSSSVVAEARFFGKEGVFLGRPPFRIAPTRAALAPGMHASVVDAWLSADFWRDLLAPVLDVTPKDGRRVALGPNALRGSLRQYWGYDEIAFQLPFDLAATRAETRRGK
jgi:hypothetical protein